MPSLLFHAIVQAIETVVFTFHISVTVLLYAKKAFLKDAFYQIIRAILIIDVSAFIFYSIGFRLILINPFKTLFLNNLYLASIFSNLIAYTTTAQYIGHLLLAFNRFTLIWYPLQNARIWKHPWYMFIIIVVPFMFIAYRLHDSGKVVITDDNIANVGLDNKIFSNVAITLALIFYIGASVISLVLNVLSLLKISILKSKKTIIINIHDNRLLFISCLLFVAQFSRTAYSICRTFFIISPELNSVLIASIPLMNDAISWVGSGSLLFLSSTVRQEYVKFYFGRKAVYSNTVLFT